MPGYTTATLTANGVVGKTETVAVTMQSETGAPVPALGNEGVPSGSEPPSEPGKDEGVSLSTEGRKPFVQWVKDDKVAWATGGATVVGLGAGIAFTLLANKASSNADNIASQIRARADADPGLDNYGNYNRHANPCAAPVPITPAPLGANYAPACQQLQDNLNTRDTDRTLSYVGWGLAGAGAVATGVFYFLRTNPDDAAKSGPEPASTAVAPVIGPDLRGLVVGGTF